MLRAAEPIVELRYLPRALQKFVGAAHLQREDPRNIEGCVLSSLLTAHFANLPPTLGFVDAGVALHHYELLKRLGFGPGKLQCTDYVLPEGSVQNFRSRFGRQPYQETHDRSDGTGVQKQG
jgi:hypothetical protein